MSGSQAIVAVDALLVVLTAAAVVLSLLQRRRPKWVAVLASLGGYWLWAGALHAVLFGGASPLGAFILGYAGLPAMLVLSALVPSLRGFALVYLSFLISVAAFVAVIWALETRGTAHGS